MMDFIILEVIYGYIYTSNLSRCSASLRLVKPFTYLKKKDMEHGS